MKKLEISEARLRELYENQKLSSYAIAKILNCGPTAILSRLKEFNINIRYPKQEIRISKDELKNLYINKKLSSYKIARLFGCGSRTIYGKLIIYGIKTRPIKRVKISKEDLFHMYHVQKMSYSEIAFKYSCTASIIFDKMKYYGILPRNSNEANTIYPKKDFSGNLIEKAYLIGFRLGDLHAIKSGFLVYIKTNTTKDEQAYLFNELFKNYGNVYIKKYENNFFNMQVSLNTTFSFLIPKKDNIDKWVLENDDYFLAFLAGYTDAEGNIGVYSKRARVRIGSYDINILNQIHEKLKSLNIHNLYRMESPAGKNRQNKDFWRVSINKKEDISRLFELIKPHLKHAKRCEDLKKAENNVIIRIQRDKSEKEILYNDSHSLP